MASRRACFSTAKILLAISFLSSMASPQIANLAAKLFAVKPELTPVQAKALILQGADRNGRVNLANPKKTMQLAGYGG